MTTTPIPVASLLVHLMGKADGAYLMVHREYPRIDEVLSALRAAKGYDEWELKYSAILVQLAMVHLAKLDEKGDLEPYLAAAGWLNVRRTLLEKLGITKQWEAAQSAMDDSLFPADAYWAQWLEMNWGREFTESFKQARLLLLEQLCGE